MDSTMIDHCARGRVSEVQFLKLGFGLGTTHAFTFDGTAQSVHLSNYLFFQKHVNTTLIKQKYLLV